MKTVLLKLSGELFSCKQDNQQEVISSVVQQVKTLKQSMNVCFSVGGGNFFRAAKEGVKLGMSRPTADMAGMLATVINGLILQDFLQRAGIETALMSAIVMPAVAAPIRQSCIDKALKNNHSIIFAGGTGLPGFSTDTNAIIRALQAGATDVWKATNVDYVYDADPALNAQAKPLLHLDYQEFLDKKLKIMDTTAINLAQQHGMTIRVFNVFKPSALLNVAQDHNVGSTISKKRT